MEKEIKEESDVVMEDDKKPAAAATPAPRSPVKKAEKASEAPKDKPVVKELDEKQKNALKTAYKFPSEPSILVHPHPKGQLISKCLCGIFNSPKKRTKKKINFTTMVPQVELFLFVIWEN